MANLNFKKISIFLLAVFCFSFGLFNFSLAACPTGSNNGICFENPLEYETVDKVLASVLDHLRTMIVVIAMVFIVVGALLYIFSAGDEGRIKTAKNAIYAAIIGLAIGIAAPSFLKEIYAALGRNSDSSILTEALPLATIALNVLNFLLSIVGIAAIIMLVAAGMAYMTAAGNEGQIETAKKMTKWAIVGIAVALGAMVIVVQLGKFFV